MALDLSNRVANQLRTAPVLPLVAELSSGLDPWDAFLRLSHLPHVLFLDSALVHPSLGRYSYVTADPFLWLVAQGKQAVDPLARLSEVLSKFRGETLPNLPPFQGGVAGLFSYDLCHYLERLPSSAVDEFAAPDLAVGVYDWVLAFDHQVGQAWLFSTGFPELDRLKRKVRAKQRLRAIQGLLQAGRRDRSRVKRVDSPGLSTQALSRQYPVPGRSGLMSNFARSGYLSAVGRAIEYIHAGDCFQVNLSQRLLAPAPDRPVELYGRLRERNPAPFAGYFDIGDFVIVSASPERFVRVDNGDVETRPIKGTRRRGATPSEDESLIADLTGSAKDRAENVMIVDLMRNDLGRVCDYGSVEVASVCRLETYQTVHHLVSEVRGRLRAGLGAVDLLRAAFPGGSVTGAPKIRAMEIIAELEPTARGAYCGSLGYLGFNGSMDTNILIRTFTIGQGWAQFPVGGGIVADSDPEREYDETWHKAEGLLRAL